MKKIPVGATIAHAYGFAFGHALTVFKAIWLPLLAQLALLLLLTRRMALFQVAMQAHDPSAVNLFGPVLLLFPLVVIFFFAQFTAATEAALGHPPQAWLTFHFGKPMWRLTGSFIAALAVIVVIYLLYFAAMYALGALAAATLKTPISAGAARVVFVLTAAAAFLAGLGIMALVMIRFMFLLAPVSISEQKGLRRSWELSRGNFWRAFWITLAIVLPVVIINYGYAFSLVGLPPLSATMSKEAREAAEMAWRVAQFNALADRWYVTLPVTGILMLFQFGAGCAAQAFAYRALTESDAPPPFACGGVLD
jgi:hypothetical protein